MKFEVVLFTHFRNQEPDRQNLEMLVAAGVAWMVWNMKNFSDKARTTIIYRQIY